MEIKDSTVEYILDVLNKHREYCRSKYCSAEEKAYYDGLFTMACMVISDGYTSSEHILCESDEGILTIKS